MVQTAGQGMDEATPTGNGRLGAMIYGGTQTETIALNEITMGRAGRRKSGNTLW